MNDAMKQRIEDAARSHVAKLADEQLTTFARGRRKFVKGKPTFVPWSDPTAQLASLRALCVFKPNDPAIEARVTNIDGVDDIDEACAIYCAAADAEASRIYSTDPRATSCA
jgi:hypothetical protein